MIKKQVIICRIRSGLLKKKVIMSIYYLVIYGTGNGEVLTAEYFEPGRTVNFCTGKGTESGCFNVITIIYGMESVSKV